MHLTDGRTGKRLLLKPGQDIRIGEGPAKSPPTASLAHRWHAIVQLAQCGQIFLIEKICPGRQNLSQLEKAGPEGTDIFDQPVR